MFSGHGDDIDPRADADQIRVMMHWLYARRDEIFRMDYVLGDSVEEIVDRVLPVGIQEIDSEIPCK